MFRRHMSIVNCALAMRLQAGYNLTVSRSSLKWC